jgi:hypothetical protein
MKINVNDTENIFDYYKLFQFKFNIYVIYNFIWCWLTILLNKNKFDKIYNYSICLNNYVWTSNGTCDLNMVADLNALNIVTGNVVRTFANCSSNYYWDFINNVCSQCVATANSTCGCAQTNFFYYPPFSLCLRNCSSAIDPFASTSLNTQFP